MQHIKHIQQVPHNIPSPYRKPNADPTADWTPIITNDDKPPWCCSLRIGSGEGLPRGPGRIGCAETNEQCYLLLVGGGEGRDWQYGGIWDFVCQIVAWSSGLNFLPWSDSKCFSAHSVKAIFFLIITVLFLLLYLSCPSPCRSILAIAIAITMMRVWADNNKMAKWARKEIDDRLRERVCMCVYMYKNKSGVLRI